MKKWIYLSVLLLVVLAACGSRPATPSPSPAASATPIVTLQPSNGYRTLMVGTMERSYRLHIPAGLDSAKSYPLLFVFHGFQENPEVISGVTGFDAIADENGFIVVYPRGSGNSSTLSWNGGACCGYAITNDVDDLQFVRQIIADVETLAKVDARRVYASGFSNGALLSFRLACEMSETFAAVAPVAGVVSTEDPCQPSQPVSIFWVHGMADTVVPYNGGTNAYGATFPPVPETLSTWTQADGCTGEPSEEQAGAVTNIIYSDCQGGTEIEFFKVDGLDHRWPVTTTPPNSAAIWDFFAAHAKP